MNLKHHDSGRAYEEYTEDAVHVHTMCWSKLAQNAAKVKFAQTPRARARAQVKVM